MARDARSDYEPARPDIWNLPLLDFIEAASGGRYKRPIHFAPIAEVIEAAERLEGVRAVAAAPVQHGKTTLIEFAIAWILLRHPDRSVIYLTYAQRKAEKHSRRIRAIYQACGGRLKADFNTIQQWQTEEGGGLLVTSRDGEITGNDAVHVFFDDPYKDREEAENVETRERLEEKFSSEVVTRLAPSGSIIIVASRWHEDDLSGVKVREGYVHVHLRAIDVVPELDEHGAPVIDDEGNIVMHEVALCPWGPDPRYPRTLAFLRSIRDGKDVTEYDWASLYQGEPRPRGGGLFRGVALYKPSELPKIVRVAVGADFAYSAGGDRIALVVLGLGEDGVIYVLAVYVWRRSVIENLPAVRAALSEHPSAPIASYVSGPEVGVLKALGRLELDAGGPIRVQPLPARASKYVRAGRCARRWNKGEVRVLSGAWWADDFIRVVCGFTGLEGHRDDEVDAMVSAHDLLTIGETFKTGGDGFKRGARVM